MRTPRAVGPCAIGLFLACTLAACSGSTGTKKPADASPDLKDAGGGLSLDGSILKDSNVPPGPDSSGSDTFSGPEVGSADASTDLTAQPSDTTVQDSERDAFVGFLDANNPDSTQAGGIDAPLSDLPVGLDGGEIDSSQSGQLDALAAEVGGEAQPAFACSSLGPIASDVSQRLCFDFSNPSDASNFTPEAGTCSIVDGAYHIVGPQDGQVTCPGGALAGSAMTTSVLSALSATDVRVHARMTSWTGPDKVMTLRSRPNGNRIELNFRSYFSSNGTQLGGDFNVSALFDCNNFTFVEPGVIPIPHYPYQSIDVDVQLRGQRLTVSVDGKQVYDDSPTVSDIDGGTLQLPTAAGSVGFGVFLDREAVFDNVIVEVLK